MKGLGLPKRAPQQQWTNLPSHFSSQNQVNWTGAKGPEYFEQLGGIEWGVGVWGDRDGQSQAFQGARLGGGDF